MGVTAFGEKLADIYSAKSPLDFLQEVLKEFPTDWDWLVWSKERVRQYNQTYQTNLIYFDWLKNSSVTEVNHFPINFAERLCDNGNPAIGIMGSKKFQAISFADFRKHLIRIGEKIYLVKLKF